LAWAAGLAEVYFDYDKSAIRQSEHAALAEAAKRLKENRKRKVLLEGHCDERGTANYNLALGERRARAAKKYLIDLGVTESQLQMVSYGKERPVCTQPDESCYQRNRRVHFTAR
jgi:peptidoglycan-associated lipoprotein